MHILEDGQKFERYHIIRQLGRGVAGISYEAEDSRLKSKVVLKLVQPWSEVSYTTRRQFFRDMQVLSVLTHPQLTTVLNYGEVAGQLYVARRSIHHGSLLGNEGRMWFNPPLTIKDAVTYTYQLSQALHLIHSYNYAHGALTFSNILISKQPHTETDDAPLLLSDTGLAQFVRRFGQPQQNILPMTAAPEQFKGHATPASDQYALAILLYVWLTGRPPFAGSPTEIEQLKLSGTISMPYRLFTEEQESILRRALNAKQEARYPSILTFAEALMNSLLSEQQTSKQKRIEMKPAPRTNSDKPALTSISQFTPQPDQTTIQPGPAYDRKAEAIPAPVTDTPQTIPEPTPPPLTSTQNGASPAQAVEHQNIEPLPQVNKKDAVLTACLTITVPSSQEQRTFMLLKDDITLGRAGSSDILLDEDTITSRHHAHIKREGGHYSIYDKRSTDGVTVNDHKLAEGVGHRLAEGDHIQIGDYNLLFSFQRTKSRDNSPGERILQ